jgi:hypothetical protein
VGCYGLVEPWEGLVKAARMAGMAAGRIVLVAHSVSGFALLERACIPYGQNAKRLVVVALKRLKPSDKFFDGCRVIAGAEAVQF